MTPELGHYALVLALGLAIVQGTLPLIGAARRDPVLIGMATTTAIAQFAFITLAFWALMHAYIVSDFSVANVAANSHTTKPLIYRISGTWGNHEGSLVMWVWILALFGAAVAVLGRNLPPAFKARVLSVQGLIGVGFIAFILFTSNPFLRLDPAPLNGQGLNPVLQDPGLAIHPPMLYLGYVGFSTAFSFAIAALIEGRVDATWARWVRPWTLAAWTALGFGIALGSYWAYYTLGWGGWWFWDPVENASFMPWLAGTALLHSSIVVEKRDTLKSWTILLAILTFALSLLGTFLVRSGVLTSVHAFASDPSRGVFILALLVIAIGGSLALYAWRAPSLRSGGMYAAVSREGGLLLNNLLLATATLTVLLGTLYPLFLDVTGGPKISVGAPFFDATFVPLMIPLFLAVPLGAVLSWKRADLVASARRLRWAMGLSLLSGAIWLAWSGPSRLLAAGGVALGLWLILGAFTELAQRLGNGGRDPQLILRRARSLPRSAFAMALAHAGLGVLVLGITVSTGYRAENILVMKPGDTTGLAGYTVRLDSVGEVKGPNYIAQRGTFTVTLNGAPVTVLESEKRYYPVEGQPTTKAGIDTGFLRDIYLVLGDPAPGGGHAVRLYYNPLILWIWGGVLIMGLAGILSLSDRRLRVGAPAVRVAPANAARIPA